LGALLEDIAKGRRVPDVIRPLVKPDEELYFVDLIMRRAVAAPAQQTSILSRLAAPYLKVLSERVATGIASNVPGPFIPWLFWVNNNTCPSL
jgi:hypothetical protein